MKNIFTKIISTTLIGTLLLPPLLMVNATQATIVITEVGAHESSGYEWVKIHNSTDAEIEMSGWKFFEDGSNHSLTSTTTILPSHENAYIVQVPEKFLEKFPDYTGIIFDSSWSSLKEEGEEIGLKNSNGELVETVTYCAVTTTSCVRSEDLSSWAPKSEEQNQPPTELPLTGENGVGAEQVITKQGLVISELMVDPLDGENEWIELFNSTQETISLEEVTLFDATSKITTLVGSVNAQSYVVYELKSSKLNNSGDTVTLKYGEDTLDTITYPFNSKLPDEGQTLARYNDAWHISTTATPETVNVISQVVTLSGSDAPSLPPLDLPLLGGVENTKPKTIHPILSELYPNPPGSDAINEYIELFNPHNEGIDLGGYILEDSFGTQYVIPSIYLGAKQYISFDRATTGIALDNDKEKVTLKDADAKTVEYAYINKPLDEHSSLQKIQNKWEISILPTKNSTNILVEPNVAPTISVTCTGKEKIGQLIMCDASDSVDKNKDLLFFEWQLIDNDLEPQRFHTDQLEISISHAGSYQITLTVSDGKVESVWKKEIKIGKEERIMDHGESVGVNGLDDKQNLQSMIHDLKTISCPENNYGKVTITDVVALTKTLSGDSGFMMGNPAREILTDVTPPSLNQLVSLEGTVRCKQGLPRIHMITDTLQLISENTPFAIQNLASLPDEIGSIVRISGAYKEKTKSGFVLSSDSDEISINTKLLSYSKLSYQENTPLAVTGLVWKIGETVVLVPRFNSEVEELRIKDKELSDADKKHEQLTIQKQSLPPWNFVGMCVSGLLLLLGIFMRTRTQGPPRLINEEPKRSRFIK